MPRPSTGRGTSTTAVAGGFVIMWSSGFIGARLGTGTASTVTLMAWRFLLIGSVLLLAWAVARRARGPARPLSRREVVVQAVIGVLGQGVFLLGTVGAIELGVTAGTAALIAALQPIAAGALAGPVLGEHVGRGQWIGLTIGVVGVGLVVGTDLSAGATIPWWAYTLPFIGMAGLVAATLLESKTRLGTPLGESLTIQCATSAVVFTLLALSTGQLAPPAHDVRFWAAVGWFIAFSTLGGYGFYWLTLRRTSMTRLSSLIYLTPPTTMIWAFLMFGERIHPLAIVGIIVCAIAVLVVHRQARSRPLPPKKDEEVVEIH